MGVLITPFLRVSPSFTPPKILSAHHFGGHLTRLTLCVAIAIPSVRHDAIGAERSNRRTFGSGTLIRFHPRGVKMSEFRDSSAGTRSEAIVSAFARREEEQPRDRRAARRNAALGDECARIATRLHSELDNIMSSDVTLGVFVKLSRRALVRSVTEHDETSFEDGLTRRSAKLAQRAFAPALASRGAKCDLAS